MRRALPPFNRANMRWLAIVFTALAGSIFAIGAAALAMTGPAPNRSGIATGAGDEADPAPDISTPNNSAFEQLRGLDTKLLRVGYRLSVANARFCPETRYISGFSLHNLRQYGDRDAARAAFGFTGEYAVLALVSEGPAAKAGLRRDDVILAVNAVILQPDAATLATLDQPPDYRAFAWGQGVMDTAFANGPAQLTTLRNGQRLAITITPVMACASRYEIEPSQKFDASADGDLVKVTSAMAIYSATDDELAAIVAHELAHNILNHRQRLNDAGISRGILQQFGRNARLTKQTEIEADQLSIWLMVNAGYDPRAAITFWQRFGPEHGHGIFSSATHYRWRKRVGLFNTEIAKIAAATRGEGGYSPPLIAQAGQPLDR